MIRLKYVMQKTDIDKSNISDFSIDLKNRRAIRDGKVKELVKMLQNGDHFSAPLVVNEIDGKKKTIDGNHRYEAIKMCLDQNPNFAISIWVAVYRDLTPDEEREVYTLWNKGTTQSATDFLKAHWETIPLRKEMLKLLPVTIYGDKQNLPIKSLVGCQISAKDRSRKFSGSYSAGKEETVSDFQQVTLDDIDLLKEFCEFMEDVFGKFDRKGNSQFYQTTPLSVFYKIWFDNRNNIPNPKLVKIFTKIFASNPKRWLDWTKSGGRSASQTFYKIALSTLNTGSQHFISDEEAVEEYEKLATIIPLIKK